MRFERLKLQVLKDVCPKTFALAQEIGNQPWRRDVWGMESDDGSFFTISTGSGKKGARPFGWREVLRTLTGKQCAVTTSDAPYHKPTNWLSAPKYVRVLRIDVDDDRAWENDDEVAILSEIRREQLICTKLGFPYSAFKTGRRGHQGIIPLPVAMPLSLASLLMEMYIHIHERSGTNSPMVDKTNLTGQMRMPGGLHRKTQDLALFIDIDSGTLYDIDTQAELMVKAFSYSSMKESVHWDEHAFKPAAQEILDWTTNQEISRDRRVLPTEMRHAVTDLEANAIVRRFQESCEFFGLKVITASDQVSNSPKLEKRHQTSSDAFSSQWAQQIFNEGFKPGGFWDWINMGGKKAIRAAHVLFGEDGARKAIEDKARSIPFKSDNDLFDRLNTIRSCMSSFHFQAENTPVDAEEIRSHWNSAKAEVKASLKDKPKPRWKLEPAIAVLSVLLADAQLQKRRFTKLGLREIERRVSSTYPEIKCCTNTVKASLQRLVESGLVRKRRASKATSVPDVYQILKAAPQANEEWIELY